MCVIFYFKAFAFSRIYLIIEFLHALSLLVNSIAPGNVVPIDISGEIKRRKPRRWLKAKCITNGEGETRRDRCYLFVFNAWSIDWNRNLLRRYFEHVSSARSKEIGAYRLSHVFTSTLTPYTMFHSYDSLDYALKLSRDKNTFVLTVKYIVHYKKTFQVGNLQTTQC